MSRIARIVEVEWQQTKRRRWRAFCGLWLAVALDMLRRRSDAAIKAHVEANGGTVREYVFDLAPAEPTIPLAEPPASTAALALTLSRPASVDGKSLAPAPDYEVEQKPLDVRHIALTAHGIELGGFRRKSDPEKS